MDGLYNFVISEKGVRVLIILIGVVVLRIFVNQLTGRVIKIASPEKPRGKRLRTLTSIFNTFFSVAILLTGVFMLLKELGFDITPLLTSAGIIGLAVGFGAQTLVKDMISGFFLILEAQFDEGDDVEINGKRGIVEKVSLRTVTIRGDKKVVHIIPNGGITLVSNFSKD